MELTISKKAFLRALNRTHPVADRKSSMPILSNILLSTDGPDAIRFAATDLYLSMSCKAEAKVTAEGTVAVGARTLFDIVKNLPEGDVTLKVGENHAAEIRAGKVRFKIPGMPGEDFPSLPNPGTSTFSTFDADQLGRLIAMTQYSMSSDETRPHLSGALFERDGQVVRMVTTDGHRLSKAEYKQSGEDNDATLKFSMLVPNKGIGELRRMVEEVRSDATKHGDGSSPQVSVTNTGGSAFFSHEEVLLSVKLADEQFPPYSKVIPSAQSRRVVVSRTLLSEALKRISLVANDKSGAVRFVVEPGLLRLTSENPDVGEGSEDIDADFAGEGVAIGFNARYLVDALASLSEDEVVLELGGALDPGVVRPVGPTEFIGVIMPMRI